MTTEIQKRTWKTVGSFKTFEEAAREKNSLTADGLKAKVRLRTPDKFDVKVCVKDIGNDTNG